MKKSRTLASLAVLTAATLALPAAAADMTTGTQYQSSSEMGSSTDSQGGKCATNMPMEKMKCGAMDDMAKCGAMKCMAQCGAMDDMAKCGAMKCMAKCSAK